MLRLFVFFLTALGCVSKCQCFRLGDSGEVAASHLVPTTKIINGEVADIRNYPYVVSLQYNGTFYGHDYDHYCCGSILNERWIITSAQCGQGRKPNEFHVRVGSDKYYENGAIYYIEKAVIHPDFNEISRDYDVALLKLSKNIIFSQNIKPIRLSETNEIIKDPITFSIVGWGASQLLGKMSDQLLKSEIQLISDENCRSVYGGPAITNRMFCVYTEGFGPCVGDSGSPAVYDNKLIGLASWSANCAYLYPTVYAKVSSVLDWIKHTAKRPT